MITIIGSLNYDLVTFTDKVPEGGETFQANSFENHLGGKGLNETLACARLSQNGGSGVRMVGNVGADAFGRELKQALIDAKVDTKYVRTIDNQSSGVAVILVETSGENRILITAGANGDLKPTNEDFETYFKDSNAEGDFVILQNEFPYTLESIEWIKSHKPTINIAYNPSPFNKEFITTQTLEKIDFLIVNEGEALDVAQCILNEVEIAKFHDTIQKDRVEGYGLLASKLQSKLDQKNTSTVVITMGSLGSVFVNNGRDPKFIKSQKVEKVIDTTGAGDTFFGGVISQLRSNEDIEKAVTFATAASGLAIQRKGAAEGIPHFGDVNKILKN
ncbi:hypothetical protein JCM33374_g5751 [Metschnikowia sp. JCM 33374]|nr:hypothetical protein JCM33374_g5751 [Metschnikowia sp. JCM 33374]